MTKPNNETGLESCPHLTDRIVELLKGAPNVVDVEELFPQDRSLHIFPFEYQAGVDSFRDIFVYIPKQHPSNPKTQRSSLSANPNV